MSSPGLYMILCSGEHEKIQMAAMAASVAAVSERPVEVFVSMNAVAVFRRDNDANRYSGGAFSDLMKSRKAPDALELFAQGKMLGDMKIYACSMALDVAAIGMDDLVADLFDGPGGLTKFLADAESGQLVIF
jgi:peroxiredoxin family protein